MRRLISVLTALALVAAPMATAGAAMAGDHHDRRGGGGGGGEQRGGGRGADARGGGGGGFFRGGEEYRGGPRYERQEQRQEPRNEPRYDPRGGYRSERVDPRYEPRYAAPTRRGGYLGPGSGGPVIQDPGRLHLRPAPRGYEWMQTPSGMALVQQGTGRVYDVVPY